MKNTYTHSYIENHGVVIRDLNTGGVTFGFRLLLDDDDMKEDPTF